MSKRLEADQTARIQPAVYMNPHKVRTRKRKNSVEPYLFLLPNGIGFFVFTLFPLLASLALSFFDWPMISAPKFIGVQNYVQLFTHDPVFTQVLLNTLYFVGVYVPLNIFVSLGLALWLSTRVYWANLFRVLFFIPVMAPMVGVALVWTLLYSPQNGILDWVLSTFFHISGPNWLGSTQWAMLAIIIMSVWQGFGYNLLVFSAGLQGIPRHYYEASEIDGANRWQTLWKITIPLLSPSLFFGIVMTVITSLQVFTRAYVLTSGGPGVSTTTLVLDIYQNGFSYFHMGYAAAIAWVLFLLVMAITAVQFLLQKRWVNYEA